MFTLDCLRLAGRDTHAAGIRAETGGDGVEREREEKSMINENSTQNATSTEDFYDLIEPGMMSGIIHENLYRQVALKILPLINSALAHILSAKTIPIGHAQVMFALNLEERSMHSVAASLGVTPQCISRGMKEFVRDNGLPQPLAAKSEEASKTYSKARTANLKKQ